MVVEIKAVIVSQSLDQLSTLGSKVHLHWFLMHSPIKEGWLGSHDHPMCSKGAAINVECDISVPPTLEERVESPARHCLNCADIQIYTLWESWEKTDNCKLYRAPQSTRPVQTPLYHSILKLSMSMQHQDVQWCIPLMGQLLVMNQMYYGLGHVAPSAMRIMSYSFNNVQLSLNFECNRSRDSLT